MPIMMLRPAEVYNLLRFRVSSRVSKSDSHESAPENHCTEQTMEARELEVQALS